MDTAQIGKYSLGLDIGIASVGWAVLDLERKRIADLGVRIFEKAEEPKTGASLAAPRREARSARRRLRRKRRRMSDVRALIASYGILTSYGMPTPEDIKDKLSKTPFDKTPWELRAEGLDRKLSGAEWARVLLHIAKHRGFKSNRTVSAEEEKKSPDDGVALKSIRKNSDLLENGDRDVKYRSFGELVQKSDRFSEHKRNKGGEYTCTPLRADIEKEIKTLFESQRKFGNEFASGDLESKYIEIFARQLPFASGDFIKSMVGYCALEPSEKRAPKAAYTSERFVLLKKLAETKLMRDGRRTALKPEEMRAIDALAYKNAKVTYKQIRKDLNLDDGVIFFSLPAAKGKKDAEEATFVELSAWHEFRKKITDALGKDYWEKVSKEHALLDDMAYALTFYKTDEDITNCLKEKGVDDELIKAVLPIKFREVGRLSLAAMRKIIPFMERGCRYDEACAAAGYNHSGKEEHERSVKLPLPDAEEIRNPVVLRAISETRKVVNAVTRKYGAPYYVHVELARDLSKSKEERDEITKRQEQNRAESDKLREEFEKEFKRPPSGRQLEKYRLWKEQGGVCMYTGAYLDPQELFCSQDDSYAEIDHIIPYSKSFDDSRSNKVLVLARANREKGDKIPFEYVGEGEKWDELTDRAKRLKDKKKAAKLTLKSLDDGDVEEMKERSLNDTRYITRYVANWIRENMLFAKGDDAARVVAINGGATAKLRRLWGVNALKNREENDLHHALDACVIAAATPAMIQKISEYSKKKELQRLRAESTDGKKIHCPEPWELFRKEVEARLSDAPAEKLKEFGADARYAAEELEALRPIFVSRRPERGATGAAHKETVRSAKYLDCEKPQTTVKKPLTSLSLKDLENMVGKERDKALYEALKKRLEDTDKNNSKKAFKDGFRKPTRDGSEGPIVRSVKIFTTDGISGLRVNGGIAENGGMARVDVYAKGGKYYLVPYYVSDIARGKVKDRAITNGKKEENWKKIDESFKFLFSLFKNDLVRIVSKQKGEDKNKKIFGYYISCNRNNASLKVISHDGRVLGESLGVQTAKLFEKYQVDVLGEYRKVKRETHPNGVA